MGGGSDPVTTGVLGHRGLPDKLLNCPLPTTGMLIVPSSTLEVNCFDCCVVVLLCCFDCCVFDVF